MDDIESDLENDTIKKFKQIYSLTEIDSSSLQFLPSIRKANVCGLQYIIHPLKSTTKISKIVTQIPHAEGTRQANQETYSCKLCQELFETGQALGGHMSRKHPGQSEDYMNKKAIRDRRDSERKKLLLAKIKYFEGLGLCYQKLKESVDGKKQIRSYLNRSKLKKLKQDITGDEMKQEPKCNEI